MQNRNTNKNFPFCVSPHRFGQFISSTLPTFAVCEKFVVMEISNEEKIDGGKNKFNTVRFLFMWPNAGKYKSRRF